MINAINEYSASNQKVNNDSTDYSRSFAIDYCNHLLITHYINYYPLSTY